MEKVMRNGVQIRPESTPPTPVSWPLCFTANTSSSTLRIEVWSNATPANLLVSTDWTNWRTYTWTLGYTSVWETITLSNVWDKVYFKNQDVITTLSGSSPHRFYMTWSIAASWDVTYLLNPNGTTTIWNGAFQRLFEQCSSLTTPPELPATTLAQSCYEYMFYKCTWLTIAPQLPATSVPDYAYREMFEQCTSLTTPPQLPATTLGDGCYEYMFWRCSALTTLPELPATNIPSVAYLQMFYSCSNIKISETQTWIYQTPYRIPSSWTGSIWSSALNSMFSSTWWTFTWTPTVNTTYYTSNTVI